MKCFTKIIYLQKITILAIVFLDDVIVKKSSFNSIHILYR
jgi:hypothetical protein